MEFVILNGLIDLILIILIVLTVEQEIQQREDGIGTDSSSIFEKVSMRGFMN